MTHSIKEKTTASTGFKNKRNTNFAAFKNISTNIQIESCLHICKQAIKHLNFLR